MICFLLLSILSYDSQCLELAKTVKSLTREKKQINTHCVSLKKDQTAYIRIDQPDETFLVDVYQPDGSLLHRHITTNFLMGESMMEVLAPVDGTYELRIKSIYHPKSGINNYSLTLVKLLSPVEIIAERDKVQKSKVFTDLKSHFQKIRSLEVMDDDFSDLQGFKKAIGNRRIVFLGEASHRDGLTQRMKARLIRFLNQEMGFDILLFESGLFEIYHHNELISQNKDVKWTDAIYSIFSSTEEFYDTAGLLERKDAKTPLNLWGIDIQFSRPYGYSFLSELKNMVSDKDFFDIHAFNAAEKIFKTIDLLNYNNEEAVIPSNDEKDMFYKTIDTYVKGLNKLDHKTEKQKVMIQALKSLKVNAQRRIDLEMKKHRSRLRDEQMANNLLWIANELKPESKIIVWCATSHAIRSYNKVSSAGTKYETKTLGDYVSEKLGDEVYAIGFTSFQGEFGWDIQKKKQSKFWPAMQIKKNQVEALEIEEYFSFIDADFGFFDFRTADFDWIKKPQYARVQGHYPSFAVWPDVLDGLIYIKTMEVAHKKE